jgi:hypothetical protein
VSLLVLAFSSDPSSRMKNWPPPHLSACSTTHHFTTEHPNFHYCFLFQVYSWTPLAVPTPLSIYLAVWSLCLPSCVTPLKRLNAWEMQVSRSRAQSNIWVNRAQWSWIWNDRLSVCPLEILKFINYFIDANSSKWCCCFRVLRNSRPVNCIRWRRGFRSKRA